MKRNFCFNIPFLVCLAAFTNCFAKTIDLSEKMQQSLVYLDISSSSYEMSQPWKQTEITNTSGYGCAVGPYEILTTAENVVNANYIQAMVYGENAYIPVTVTKIDYEYNLCLLEIAKDAIDKPLTPLSFKESYRKVKHWPQIYINRR